jgi:hypothetical protein
MSFKIFIPQESIDRWVGADQVELSGELIAFRGGHVSLRMTPGYFFARVSGDSQDTNGLLGRVKTTAATSALGAEAYMSSVLLGETAYDVEPGFIAEPIGSGLDRTAVQAAVEAAGD